MSFDPNLHHRRSVRLPGFEYNRGAYFVTICTEGRSQILSRIIDNNVQLTPAGRMIQDAWNALPNQDHGIAVDELVVMPNHVHGVLWLARDSPHDSITRGRTDPRAAGTAPGSLARVIQAFKSRTTHSYTIAVKEQGWPRFNVRLWQRNYFEHVIRDDEALAQIRYYIRTNPQRWNDDVENPAGRGRDEPGRFLRDVVLKPRRASKESGEGRTQGSPLHSEGA